MRVCALGPLEVWDDGRELPLGSGRQRALFVLLLLHAGEVVSKDRLIDGLWGERPPASAAKVLQGYVSQLRRALPAETIVTRASGYLLRGGETDAAEFERLVERARGERPEAAAATLREALALWRGDALSDVEYEAWAQGEIGRLEELRLVALEERIEADLRLGEAARVVSELETIVAEYPLRERLRAVLMLALYRSERQADALAAYQDARRALVEELGIEPGKPLRELHQAILRQDASLDLAAGADPDADQARTPFVGREAELAELVGGLEQAVKGKGRLFFLVGEPGIGKSRLADEVVRQARRRGMQVLVGRCWEAGGAPAYWPWVQSLRRYVREAEPDALRAQVGAGAAELAQIVPELRELLPDLPEPTSAEAEGARFRLFDATAEFLRNASLVQPILLVLDDLHAADAPSLLLLQFLTRELGSARVLLLGAYRDVDPVPGQALTATLAEVARESTTRRLLLRGLSERDVAEYLDRAAAAIGSRELAAALHEETEGNPLFLTETVRLLSLEGLKPEPSVRVIPQTVRDVIARRLAHLSEQCNRTLLLGSVLGREFALDALARLGRVSQDALLETLDEAMLARVVSDVPGGPGRFRFAHVLIRDTLYDGLTTARRVSLHRLAAEALEALYGEDPGPHLAELAHHAIAGNDFDKGVLYARRAGDRALTLLAYEEAVRLYEVGLHALEPAGRAEPAKRYELLLALGHAQVRAGDGVSAKQTFLQAASAARQLERPQALARAALGYGGRFVWARAGSDELLVPLLREALATTDERDTALRARLLARLAAALRDEADPEPRALLSQEAVDIARLIGDPATLAYALVARYAALWSPGSTDERLAIATELVDLAQRIGDKEREVEGHGFRLHALLELGDVEAAEAQLAARARLTNEMHQPAQRWVQLVLESMRNVFVGDFSAAEETIHQALELGERAQGDEARLTFVLQLFVLRREQGRLAEIESELESCASRYRIHSVHRCALSNLSIELGRAGEAQRRLAELAAENFGSVSRDAEWLVAIAFLAETCGCLDDRGRAATLYHLLLPHSKLNVADGAEVSTGAVSRYLGILASTITRFDQAAQHFEDALAMNERMGARPWLAHTQHDYARMLLTQGGHANRRRAEELVEAALATYRELGMDAHVARISTVASTL